MAIGTEHTVKAFDNDIGELRGHIAEMGGRAEAAINSAMEALVKRAIPGQGQQAVAVLWTREI